MDIKKLLKEARQELRPVRPGHSIRLKKVDCDGSVDLGVEKEEADGILAELQHKLDALQELLYAEHKHKVLVVLQAMDTAGKDGVIRHVFKGVNPQGVRVVSFKAPTQAELDHDYLWRIHSQVPAKGEIVIFNRSYYEDVLVTRVHGLIEKDVWTRRYGHINAFEQMLSDEGVTILKFFLHISPDEQKARLQARLKDPDKNWKFSGNDVKERAFWFKYMEAYEDAINATSTECAPWHVIPANKKWYRNLAVSLIMLNALNALDMKYPKPGKLLKPAAII
ncbi:MAG: polyphosphate kinase 2 family protein [Candidatus Omnitrophica bacterium]|nr:polyphosphate kinase 2 family protein [Candidatus Omnitrophota bacterium]